MSDNKNIERHERFRLFKNGLIEEFAKDNCVDDRNKTCMRKSIDISMATGYQIVNEFSIIDTVIDSIDELKSLVESLSISQQHYFKDIDSKIYNYEKKIFNKIMITFGIFSSIITFLLGVFKFVL